ncbi:MAG: hypothetical protein JO034_32150 [Singulisphaera sp.]|nr:hypothetical protein [Singulisphaera sp.]
MSRSRGRPKAPPKTALRRPHVLTLEAQRLIIAFLAEGNFLETALAAAGVSKDCFLYWRRLWDEGNPRAQIYADFFCSLKRAMALGEVNALNNLRADPCGWQRWAWFLERRHPHHWARKGMIMIKGVRDLSELSDGELENLERRLRGRRLA